MNGTLKIKLEGSVMKSENPIQPIMINTCTDIVILSNFLVTVDSFYFVGTNIRG